MPLPDDYLVYPNRNYGFDNPRYAWTPADRRAPIALTDGTKSVATLIIPLEFFPLNPKEKPFKHPGAMKTPYPDLRHFTTRDYGNRVGVYRLLRELGKRGLKATFAINSEVAKRYPPLVEEIAQQGHEIAAHGVSTAHIHHEGLSEEDERDFIAQARSVFPHATTWMSPARNESYRTLDLLSEAGFSLCLDWEADMRPLPFETKTSAIWTLPNYGELGDFKLLIERSQSENEWSAQILEAAAYHVAQYDSEGASAFAFTLTPYVLGQPFRINAVRQVLDGLLATDGLRIETAQQSCAAFQEAVV